jgi:hypothetical protein
MTILVKRYIALRLALIPLLAITCSSGSSAHPDSTDYLNESILFIGHLNYDSVPDSVYGGADAQHHYLPHSLHWGRAGSPSEGHHVAVTTIRYPDWQEFTGTVAFQKMNADSVTDIIFYLWGKTGEPNNLHDTIRPILLFGQPSLDSLSIIDLSSVSSFQLTPFVAMEMRTGSEFVHPALRDLSGKPSYMLAPVDVIVDPNQQPGKRTAPGDAPAAGASSGDPHARLYPNPTSASARLEMAALPAGEYSVDIVSLDGAVLARRAVSVPTSGDLLGLLDVRSLPVGYYTVRVDRGAKHIGTYPIIITR